MSLKMRPCEHCGVCAGAVNGYCPVCGHTPENGDCCDCLVCQPEELYGGVDYQELGCPVG